MNNPKKTDPWGDTGNDEDKGPTDSMNPDDFRCTQAFDIDSIQTNEVTGSIPNMAGFFEKEVLATMSQTEALQARSEIAEAKKAYKNATKPKYCVVYNNRESTNEMQVTLRHMVTNQMIFVKVEENKERDPWGDNEEVKWKGLPETLKPYL